MDDARARKGGPDSGRGGSDDARARGDPLRRPGSGPRDVSAAPRTEEFAAVLHRILARERSRSMRDVAAALGLSYPAFYARISGRVPFSTVEIQRVLQEVPDPRLADALLAGTPFGAFLRARLTGGRAGEDALGTALRAMQEVLALVQGLSAAEEASALQQHLDEAERALAILRHVLPYAAARRPAPVPASGGGDAPTFEMEALPR